VGFGFVDHVSPLMLAVVLGDVLNLNILPTFFEVFGNKTAVTVVRFFLAAQQAPAIRNFARIPAFSIRRGG
jgi:hypothetical protein